MSTRPAPDPVRLPPGPPLPSPAIAGAWVLSRQRLLSTLERRYGSAFTIKLPPFGSCVVLTSADLTKQLFTTSPEIAASSQPNLGNVLGPGSTFALEGPEHRRRRKLLVPPFHGRRLRAYEDLIVSETIRVSPHRPS